MGNKIQLTERARDDLSEIWEYTYERWSETQADRYFLMLHKVINSLPEKQTSARNYSFVFPGILGIKAGRHLIFFHSAESSGEIIVLRILHQSMDFRYLL